MTTPSLAHGALEQVTGKVKHVLTSTNPPAPFPYTRQETVGKVVKNSGLRVDGIAQNAVGKAEIQGAKQLRDDEQPEKGAGNDAEDQRIAAAQEKGEQKTP
ncbi:hypothetical protein HDU87_007175 [Geranomyces variabilis]|uniref:Uncharacterized protein n=1 Tax=Geranomyces variabilis TaxID=109894 RepID=A0AAD5TEC5_9FUNG|nr:hypothetical protein HDU87_007175 [Geranomyces variabilis]